MRQVDRGDEDLAPRPASSQNLGGTPPPGAGRAERHRSHSARTPSTHGSRPFWPCPPRGDAPRMSSETQEGENNANRGGFVSALPSSGGGVAAAALRTQTGRSATSRSGCLMCHRQCPCSVRAGRTERGQLRPGSRRRRRGAQGWYDSLVGRVAELADAQDSGSCEVTLVRVQVPPRPPRWHHLPWRSTVATGDVARSPYCSRSSSW